MTKEEALKRDEEIAALKVKGVDVMKREWFEGLMSSGGTHKKESSHSADFNRGRQVSQQPLFQSTGNSEISAERKAKGVGRLRTHAEHGTT